MQNLHSWVRIPSSPPKFRNQVYISVIQIFITPDRPEPAGLFYNEAIIKFLINVITTEWGNRHLYKIYDDEKFNIKDKNELINKLPLSHKLYEEFIEKILNPIDHVVFEKINEYNFEPKIY